MEQRTPSHKDRIGGVDTCHWNVDVHSFFNTAAADVGTLSASVACKTISQTPEDCISAFLVRQEAVENVQDLVLVRTSYMPDQQQKQHGWGFTMQEALLQAWTNGNKKSATPPVQQTPIAPADADSVVIPQVYITFWPAVCLLGMVVAIMQFVLVYRGSGNVIAGLSWSETSMTKHSAMLLVCIYSALAWTLSNGLVINPRKCL